jgi:D-proline reductase (dithiol) PrdB
MAKVVDSYRFIGGMAKTLVKTWIKLETPREIPWTPLAKPMRDRTVALISSGGMALKTDRPFDQEGERQNPWWGDPSFRVIPQTAKSGDIRVYHQHIDPRPAEEDLNCLLPIERLGELVAAGEVGRAALSHYSIMGYLLEPQEMLETSIPAIIGHLRKDAVDVVALVPA